jgi:hypothetical protein
MMNILGACRQGWLVVATELCALLYSYESKNVQGRTLASSKDGVMSGRNLVDLASYSRLFF